MYADPGNWTDTGSLLFSVCRGCRRGNNVLVTGEMRARTAEAETEVMRNSQVSDAAGASGEMNSNAAANSLTRTTSPAAAAAAAVTINETPSSAVAGKLDRHGSSENGLQPTRNDASLVALDKDCVPRSRGSEDVSETPDRSGGGSVSCVRDLINEAIEKTLQDPVEQCRSLTPPPSLGGQSLALTIIILLLLITLLLLLL